MLLGVAVRTRALTAALASETTFFQELRTPQLPTTPVPVGYWRQNGRCHRCQAKWHSNSDDFVSHFQKGPVFYVFRFYPGAFPDPFESLLSYLTSTLH